MVHIPSVLLTFLVFQKYETSANLRHAAEGEVEGYMYAACSGRKECDGLFAEDHGRVLIPNSKLH